MGNFSNNAITDNGRILLSEVMAGAVFTPTRIAIGSGNLPSGTMAQDVTNLVALVKNLSISKKEHTPDGKLVIGGVYSNADVTTSFYFRELGLYAKAVYLNENGTVKSEGEEILFSYGNAGATADLMPAYSTATVVEKMIDIVTWVGNTAQVDLTIASGVYASKEDVENVENIVLGLKTTVDETIATHLKDTGNPHKVTAAQVGLGNVPNVSTNNQKPTYTVASTLANLVSGEVLSTAMGKIAKAVSDFISHLANKNNPHGVTAAQVGARPSNWMPTAADVGARPSTWMPTASDVGARPSTWMPTAAQVGAAGIETGSYIGTGTYSGTVPNSITFAKGVPMLVIIQRDVDAGTGIIIPQSGGGMFTDNNVVRGLRSALSGRKLTWYDNTSNVYQLNELNVTYRYTAFIV